MAGLLDTMGITAQSGASLIDTFVLIIAFLALIVVVGALVWVIIVFVVWYKHKAHIMNLTGGMILHSYDRMRIWKDKNGVQWMKLLKARHKDQVPPSEAKGLTQRGKYHVDLYYTDDGNYVFASQQSHKITQNIKESSMKRVQAVGEDGKPLWKELRLPVKGEDGEKLKDEEGNTIMRVERIPVMRTVQAENLTSWPTSQRNLYIQMQKESLMWKHKNLLDFFTQHGGLIVSGFTMIVVVTVVLLILNEMMPHLVSAGSEAALRAQYEAELAKWLAVLHNQSAVPVAIAPG